MASKFGISTCQSVIPALMGTDRNITFLLDTSEAMTAVLGTVKNLIIQTLLAKSSLRNSLFNIISFSYKVTPWTPHMIPCAPDTVYEALGWIHTLKTSPGSDLVTALNTAFSDPTCQSVHLVTNSLPDNPGTCLSALLGFATRPVRTFYISDEPVLDSDTSDFLKCLTLATRGCCYRLTLKSDSTAAQVALLHSADHQMQDSSSGSLADGRCLQASHCSPIHVVCPFTCWCSKNPFSPTPCVSARLMQGSSFFPGCRVLARREMDGFYYLGTIIHQLQDRGGVFMVQFDTLEHRGGYNSELNPVQLTCQPDMVNLSLAHKHSIVPGDCVLAPWDPQMNRFAPGRIVSGMEIRDPLKGGQGDGLLVHFWNGMRIHVINNLAVWIAASHHERIIGELQSHTFRPYYSEHIHCNHPDWTSPCCVHQGLSPKSSFCLCPTKTDPLFTPTFLTNTQGTQELEAGPNQLNGLQISKDMVTAPKSSDSSEDEEGGADETFNRTASGAVSRSVNTEISCLRKAYTEPIQSRPVWRYWRRGSPEPQHKQPGRIVRSSHVSYSWPEKSSWSPAGDPSSNSISNRSALFDRIPDSGRKSASVRELFGWTQADTPSKPVSPLAAALNKISAMS